MNFYKFARAIVERFESAVVFPLRPGSKIPHVDAWKEAATRDSKEIYAWSMSFPDANVALVTGLVSGVSVVDVDDPNLFKDFVKGLGRSVNDINTYTVKTPSGGYHLYFRYDPTLKQGAKRFPGGDIRNDGGYVVGPGSVFESGQGMIPYVAAEGPLSSIPEWLLKAISEPAVPLPTASASGAGGILEGSRNDNLTRFAGALRRQGASDEGLVGALLALNDEMCVPPLAEREVRAIARSSERYIPEPDSEVPEVPSYVIVPVQDYIPEMIQYLEDRDKVLGEPTGMESLDVLLGGGFREGELIAIHAEAKSGKSTLIHRLILNYLKRDIPIGYASRELFPDREVLPSLFSMELQRNVLTSKEEPGLFEEVAADWKLYFSHGYGTFPAEDAYTWIKNCRDQYGVKIFFMDHLHYMLQKEESIDIAELIKKVKKACLDLQVCIVMVVQPSKLQDGQRLGFNTLRGGASIGQAVNSLITISRKDNMIAEVELKAKRSHLGRLGKFHIRYEPKTHNVEEVEIIEDPENEPWM